MSSDATVSGKRRRWAQLAGLALLAIWSAYWAVSLSSGFARMGAFLWMPADKQLGFDFIYSYRASLHWLAGGDPYAEDFGDPEGRVYHYPPICLPFFAWCSLVSQQTGVVLWMAVILGTVAWAVWDALKCRRSLGLEPVPLILALALVLFTTPVMFALDRGNSDIVPLAMILLACRLLAGRPSGMREFVAGSLLAVSFGIKIYPGVLALGLIASRKWRALCSFVAIGALIWAASPRLTSEFFNVNARYLPTNAQYTIDYQGHRLPVYYAWSHPLSYAWDYLKPAGPLGQVRGGLAALLFILPVVSYVSWEIFRRKAGAALRLPYFAWLASIATFLPQISNDYNLIFFPIAAIGVYSLRDRLPLQIMTLPAAFWLQPFSPVHYQWPPVGGVLLLAIKLLGAIGIGAMLLVRAREYSEGAEIFLEPASPTTRS